MSPVWNKGKTKDSHSSIKKISDTMKSRKLDNFTAWREKMREEGKFGNGLDLIKDGDLAELIGMTLGDGSIHKYARTEGLRIVLPVSSPLQIKRYETLIEKVFNKRPTVTKRKTANCVDLRLYQKDISKRLGIQAGARALATITIPGWIRKKRAFVIRYLRGLYEAEGCFCVHKSTYTYKFQFTNKNRSMLDNVFLLMTKLGFHPHMSQKQVQISRKEEVYAAMELIGFRKY